MKLKLYAILLVVLMIFPAVIAENDDSTGSSAPVASAEQVRAVAANQVAVQTTAMLQDTTAQLNRCITFVKNNRLSDTPRATCTKLLQKEADCTAFLKRHNIDSPAGVCARIFAQIRQQTIARNYIAAGIAQSIPEHRLRNVDSAIANSANGESFVSSLGEADAKKYAYLTRAQQQKIIAMDNAAAYNTLSNYQLTKVKINNQYQQRVISKNKVIQADQNYKTAKNRYENAQKNYDKNKALFLTARNLIRNCQGNSTECAELEEEIIGHAKAFLTDRVNMVIEHLKKIRERVEAADDLPEDEANDIVADIDAAIAAFEEILDEIEAATTKEEIQDIAKEISTLWRRMNAHALRYAARLVHAKVGEIIQRSEHLEERLDCSLEQMEDQGIDISSIEAKVDLFSARIDEARTKYREGREIFEEAKDMRDDTDKDIRAINELLNQAKKLIREAHTALNNAHAILKEIIRDIKASGGDITGCVESSTDLGDDEVYEIEEVDDEEEDDVDEEDEEDQEDDEVDDEDDEEEDETPVNLATIDSTNCWKNKPSYRPGFDKGYYIWQGVCANFIWVDWSGDTRPLLRTWRNINEVNSSDANDIWAVEVAADFEEAIEGVEVSTESQLIVEEDGGNENKVNCSNADCATAMPTCMDNEVLVRKQTDDMCCPVYRCLEKPKLLYPVRGKITSNGRIFDLGVRRFDGTDVIRFSGNTIWFKGRVGPNFDGLYFRTTGDIVFMELWFDGEKDTEVIHIGKNGRNPTNDPFKLKVRPAVRPKVCDNGQIIYNNKCVYAAEGNEVGISSDETIVVDDGTLRNIELTGEFDDVSTVEDLVIN